MWRSLPHHLSVVVVHEVIREAAGGRNLGLAVFVTLELAFLALQTWKENRRFKFLNF